jgi:hypothetical protein
MKLDSYTVAFEDAHTELMQLSKQFHELTLRKEQLSLLCDVLRTLLSEAERAKMHDAGTR